MIDAAISTLKRDPSALVDGSLTQDALAETEYRVGSAEKLDWIPDASVDLVTAGMLTAHLSWAKGQCAEAPLATAQAAHWFKHGDVYAELQRILKPGGTVAYIGYGYMHFPEYPSATPKIHNFGLKKLGRRPVPKLQHARECRSDTVCNAFASHRTVLGAWPKWP